MIKIRGLIVLLLNWNHRDIVKKIYYLDLFWIFSYRDITEFNLYDSWDVFILFNFFFKVTILKRKIFICGLKWKVINLPIKFKDSTEFWRKVSRWWWIVNRLVDLCNGFRAYGYYLLAYGLGIVLGFENWFMQYKDLRKGK